jgi:predicted regulator of Ras-like GTPase activity (Roadblock/LC7/MglB family)
VTRADGSVVRAMCAEGRARLVAQHLAQVLRMTSTALSRAGLGSFHRGVIDTDGGTTFVLSDVDLILTATLDRDVDVNAALAEVGRLPRALGLERS